MTWKILMSDFLVRDLRNSKVRVVAEAQSLKVLEERLGTKGSVEWEKEKSRIRESIKRHLIGSHILEACL